MINNSYMSLSTFVNELTDVYNVKKKKKKEKKRIRKDRLECSCFLSNINHELTDERASPLARLI